MARPRPSVNPRRPRSAATTETTQVELTLAARRDALRAVQRMWFDVLRTSERFHPTVPIDRDDRRSELRRVRPSTRPLTQFLDELLFSYERFRADTRSKAKSEAQKSSRKPVEVLTPLVKSLLRYVGLARLNIRALQDDLAELEGRLLRLRMKAPKLQSGRSSVARRRRITNQYDPLEVLRLAASVFAVFAPLIADKDRDIVGYALEARARQSMGARSGRPTAGLEERREWMRDRRAMEPREKCRSRAKWVVEHRFHVDPADPRFDGLVRRMAKLRH